MDVEYLFLKDGSKLMERPAIVQILHAHQIYTEADFMQVRNWADIFTEPSDGWMQRTCTEIQQRYRETNERIQRANEKNTNLRTQPIGEMLYLDGTRFGDNEWLMRLLKQHKIETRQKFMETQLHQWKEIFPDTEPLWPRRMQRIQKRESGCKQYAHLTNPYTIQSGFWCLLAS